MKNMYRAHSCKPITPLNVLFCLVVVLSTLGIGFSAYAGCGPDYIIAGHITIDGVQIDGSDAEYIISIHNSDGNEIDSFIMGQYGEWYVLRLPTEDIVGSPCDAVIGTKNEDYNIYINDVKITQGPIRIDDIDEAKRQLQIDIEEGDNIGSVGDNTGGTNSDGPGCFIGLTIKILQ